MLSYFLKTSLPQSIPLPLDQDLLQWPDRVLLGVEQRIFQFRAGQIQLTLDNKNNKYTTEGSALYIKGQQEILIFEDNWEPNKIPLWAGTIDPTSLEIDDDESTLTIRVLQHGSHLNRFLAGKQNWGFSGNVNYEKLYRYTKQGSQWQALDRHGNPLEDSAYWQEHLDNSDLSNSVLEESTEIFATPDFVENHSDPFERQQWQKEYRFATDSGVPDGPEEFITRTGVLGDHREIVSWQPYTPWRHPDFTADPSTYNLTLLTQEQSAWVKSPTPTNSLGGDNGGGKLRSFPITELIQNLIGQFNSQLSTEGNLNNLAFFPITYNGTAEDLLPPAVSAAFNLLEEGRLVRNIDLITSGNRTYLLVNWLFRSNGEPTDDSIHGTLWFPWTLYEILNGSFLQIIREEEWLAPTKVWSSYEGCPRFSRAHTNPTGFLYFYQLQESLHNPLFLPGQTGISWRAIEIDLTTGNTDWLVSFPTAISKDTKFYDYCVNFSAGRPGVLDTTQNENLPLQGLQANGFSYKLQGNRLIAAGSILLDRVALEYKDTSFAKILSELAVITDSTWYITPNRELIFKSRSLANNTITIPAEAVNPDYKVSSRTLLDEPNPSLSLTGIKIADGHMTALKNYYSDNRLRRTYFESRIAVERNILIGPAPNFALEFDGLDDLVLIPHTSSLNLPNSHSIECWAKFARIEAAGIFDLLIAKGINTISEDSPYAIYQSNTTVNSYESQSGATRNTNVGPKTIDINQWYHILLVNDTVTAKFYVNGILIVTDASPATSIWNNTHPLTFGCAFTADIPELYDKFFRGILKNVKLFSRTFTAAEVLARYSGGIGLYTADETSLISGWLMNEGSGHQLRDIKNINNGFIYGARFVPCTILAPPPVLQTILPADQILMDPTMRSLGTKPIIQELEIDDNQYYLKTLSA